jgi:hypothetical protein
MSEQQTSSQAADQSAGHRCVCEEFVGHVQDLLGVSGEVRQHLTNSRIEFLKAIRGVLDQRIERLSKHSAAQGTKIAVE